MRRVMKPISMSKMWLRVRRSAGGLLKDRSGIAAVEFAVIVPMMLVMFFGTVEFSSAVAIDRKVTLMARTLANLTSQGQSVNDAAIANFRAASGAIMTPYSGPLYPAPNTTVSELYIDPATGVARVQWSKGDQPRTVGTPVAIPASLISLDAQGKIIPQQYLIFSEVNVLYTPTVGYVMKSGVSLSDVAYTRPRQSICVFYPATPAPPTCPVL
jgi:Flp pilus assembly protein TadG